MIVLDRVSLRQGNFSLAEISLEIPTGQYGVLMGRTGCGKTSLLEAIAGLRPIVAGRIELNSVDVTAFSPGARGVGYVPQDGALFKTKTVFEQLAFALVVRHWERERIEKRVAELAAELGISELLARYPIGLSGGEIQRVALGRALAFHPRVLLLDEPLSSIDEETRGQMVELLKRVTSHEKVTVLHVTHSRAEANGLGDVIYRLYGGAIFPANGESK
jgi:ABC-type sugar transport system ATPase subunit